MEYKTEFGPGDEVYYLTDRGEISSSAVIEVSITARDGSSASVGYKIDSVGKEVFLPSFRVYASPEALSAGILARYRKK